MSTELTVASDMGMSLAEAMGISTEAKTSVGMPRLTLIHTGIMGNMEVNGKQIKTEVIPAGAYKYSPNADTTIYSVNPEIRIFAVRQQWTRWDNEQETMLKTVYANDLKGDLKDNNGTFNIGRPSGYIEDFKALPRETQDLVRSVKRTKVVFGTVIMHNATDENGNPVSGYDTALPFCIDIKNTLSIKAVDNAINVLGRKNLLPIQHSLVLGAEEHSIPTGATYCSMTFSSGSPAELTPEDNDTLRDFMQYIEYVNGMILDAWAEKNTGHGMSSDDVDLVNEFVNVEEAD